MTPEQTAFVATLHQAVATCLRTLIPSAVDLVTAHGCFESGYGAANAYKRGNNAFNITAGPAWKGAQWVDVGGDVNAKGQKITQHWRAYPTLGAGVLDYYDFLGPHQNAGRYTYARAALESGSVVEFARLLHVAGYYELAPGLYAERLAGVLARISPILHGDSPSNPGSAVQGGSPQKSPSAVIPPTKGTT